MAVVKSRSLVDARILIPFIVSAQNIVLPTSEGNSPSSAVVEDMLKSCSRSSLRFRIHPRPASGATTACAASSATRSSSLSQSGRRFRWGSLIAVSMTTP